MSLAMSAVMILFGGQDLEGWITLAGRWGVENGAMVCKAAPASIRSSYESDQFILSFEYRCTGKGRHSLYLHSKLDVPSGAIGLLLTPKGLVNTGSASSAFSPQLSTGEDGWIKVQVDIDKDICRVASSDAAGNRNPDFTLPVAVGSRGFIRFEAAEPGLQIRNVKAVEPGFTSMFDGKTLEGWEIQGRRNPNYKGPGWYFKNGILHCVGKKTHWLRSGRNYDNLIIRLEYQLPNRGNSGIYLRAPKEGWISRTGLEIQLIDEQSYEGRLKPYQRSGSVYAGFPPEVAVSAPKDQWNAIEVLLEGKRIRTILNSVRLYDAYLDDVKKDLGSSIHPLATRPAVGYVGFQDHHSPAKFRNVRIRELGKSPTTQTAPAR
ncbi:MAG: DUF1080 domain-containing protein [Planctomycetota bacterium]|nr:MAG: DUF1080 domain-containing protein [Planctomycetota bacterium]